MRSRLALELACLTLLLPCIATSSERPKNVAKFTLPGKAESFGRVAIALTKPGLYSLYWVHGTEPGESDLTLAATDPTSGKTLRSVILQKIDPDRHDPVAFLSIAASEGGKMLLCSSGLSQFPASPSFGLWILDAQSFAVLSALEPQHEPIPTDYGFTNQGKTVRFASYEQDKRNQVTAATIWDASTADLKTVVSKETVHFDPIGFQSPSIGTGDIVWNQAHSEFGEYDLATGRKIRTLPSPGDLASGYALNDGLLVVAQKSVPSRKDWGGYLLRYGAGDAPIHSPTVTGCALLPQGLAVDQRYAVALCDGTKLNTFFDSYYTAKLEAVTFDLKTMAILAEVPLNRRYEHTALAIATDAGGILEAISDHAGEVQILRIPTAAQGGGDR